MQFLNIATGAQTQTWSGGVVSSVCCTCAEGADSALQAGTKAVKPPPSQLFDILPIEGTLGPGQTEQVDFSFYAYPGVRATATAACAIANGPTYEVRLVCCFKMLRVRAVAIRQTHRGLFRAGDAGKAPRVNPQQRC